ncbi:MAG: hypothetical protein AAGU16_00590 [Desulfitobacterium hafniense]
MSEIYELALKGLDLVPEAIDHLAAKLSKEDQELLKSAMELQYKAVQVSAGIKVHPDTMNTLIDKVVAGLCSINSGKSG